MFTALPPELIELAKLQLERLPAFAAELAEVLCAEEEFYRGVAPDELRKVCEANLERALVAVINGGELELDAARRTATAQAGQGVPLSAVLRAFRIAGTFTYEALLEHGAATPEQMLQFSTSVWKVIDVYSEASAQAYREYEAEHARYDEETRLRLFDGLLDGRSLNSAEVEQVARVLGLPVNGTFVVLVSDTAGAASTVLDARRRRCAWRPGPDTEVGVVTLDGQADLALVRQSLAEAGVSVGLSVPFAELAGAADAVRRARIARRSLPAGQTGVVLFGESPVTSLVAGAPALARDLAREVLGGVLTVQQAEREVLLGTLHAWYAGGGSAKEAAQTLFVHPNTVRYRLRRIQELTGCDLTHPRAVAELFLALETVRLDPTL